jgi:membrane protein
VRFLRKLVSVIVDAGRGYTSDGCSQQAAGISYRLLFSIAPLAIVLVSIFGLVLQNDELRENVTDRIVEALPVSVSGRKDVENAITAIATPASAAGLISLLVFLWAATGVMGSIRRGLERAMGVTESRPFTRGKLVDLALIGGTAFLILLSAVLTVAGPFIQKASARIGSWIDLPGSDLSGGLIRLLTFALSIGVVLLLYRFVPARGISFRHGLAGATMTAVLLQLITLASGYIYDKTTKLSVIYGTLTAALVFLYSVYLYSSALLLGAEVATAWARPPVEGPSEPVRMQVKRALVGLFVRQKEPEERPPDADPHP